SQTRHELRVASEPLRLRLHVEELAIDAAIEERAAPLPRILHAERVGVESLRGALDVDLVDGPRGGDRGHGAGGLGGRRGGLLGARFGGGGLGGGGRSLGGGGSRS